MKTIENEHKVEFHSEDENGLFMVRICKRKPLQIQLLCQNNEVEAFANVDKKELTAIRDMISNFLLEQ